MSAQRFRVRFRKGERVRYISHLDVLRFWERAIRRAGLPLSYSQGFTPHPKLAFAGPLPLGFIGEAEIMDVSLDECVDPVEFRRLIESETSEDLGVVDIQEIPVGAPSPQAQVLWADYQVDLPAPCLADLRRAVSDFVGRAAFPWTEDKNDRSRSYDLRAAVASIAVEALDGGARLAMRLQAGQELTARPEQVLAALFPGHEHGVISRTSLVLDEWSPARDAWRRRGQFET